MGPPGVLTVEHEYGCGIAVGEAELVDEYNAAQDRVIDQTSAGGTTVNHVWMHLGVPGLPFGGVGESGMGAYHGKHSFDAFSHRRAVLKKPNFGDAPLAFPPYVPWKLKWLKRLL